MSRNTKTYGKRGGSTPVASIQFDKTIADGNKRPTASKSAGVVGKWGTTSFTSLRSSQVNGSKPAKRGMSPVKCLPVDYGMPNQISTVMNNSLDAFSFDSGANSGATIPSVPRPRKFFKSRATEDVAKNPASLSSSSSLQLSNCVDYPLNQGEVHSGANFGGGIGYLSPSYTSPTAKTPAKRGRGRPKGTKTVSPRGVASNRTNSARGATTGRGRRRGRNNRTVRGQAGGRGKRKRPQWEGESEEEEEPEQEPEEEDEPEQEEEQEEETAGSELDEPMVSAVDPDEEEKAGIDDFLNKNGSDGVDGIKEESKPPIKLRIIRRNDTDAFVSKVDSVPDDGSAEMAAASPDHPSTDPVEEQPHPVESEMCTAPPQYPAKEEYSPPHHSPVQESEPFQIKPAAEENMLAPMEVVANPDPAPSVAASNVQQRKSSIFKSRVAPSSQSSTGKNSSTKGEPLVPSKGKKGLALYRHTWHENDGRKAVSGGADTDAAASSGSAVAGQSPDDQQRSAPSHWDDMEDEPVPPPPPTKVARLGGGASAPSSTAHSEPDEEDGMADGSGALRCSRKVKDYYTVVRNVKKAHQIQESGEFQEFNDDVDYILDALKDRNPTATRCLSAMSLASKCMEPAFRMHLRAHSTVAKFFQALKDAPSKPSVALCTSCIMFVLTQDRLNMDLDRDSLELMLNLLEIDAVQVDLNEGKELEKNKLKVRELCEEMVRKGHAPHLQLDKITAAQLAMETLLSLTSKKAGEWFKEELRVLGGLDHIIQTVTVCTAALSPPSDHVSNWEWDKARLDALKKVDRCLRVLENVTFQNEENQIYLMEFCGGRLVDATLNLLKLLSREVAAIWSLGTKDSLSSLLSDTLSNLMKVVMNLTHDSNDDSIGSKVYGDKSLTWETSLTCLLHTSLCLPEDKSFDIMTLALGILINLVERSSMNRDRLMIANAPSGDEDIFDSKPLAIKALIDLFINKEESARLEEARTDEILDGKPGGQSDNGSTQSSSAGGPNETSSTNAGKTQEDAMEETVKKLLHKAGRHMEDSMVAAYVALLLGYVVMKNEAYEYQVKELLPEKKFTQMVVVLKKFYEFLKLTANAVTSTRGLKNTQMVIKFMEASDRGVNSRVKKEEARYMALDDTI